MYCSRSGYPGRFTRTGFGSHSVSLSESLQRSWDHIRYRTLRLTQWRSATPGSFGTVYTYYAISIWLWRNYYIIWLVAVFFSVQNTLSEVICGSNNSHLPYNWRPHGNAESVDWSRHRVQNGTGQHVRIRRFDVRSLYASGIEIIFIKIQWWIIKWPNLTDSTIDGDVECPATAAHIDGLHFW